ADAAQRTEEQVEERDVDDIGDDADDAELAQLPNEVPEPLPECLHRGSVPTPCSWWYIWRSRARARNASAATPPGLSPRRGASCAGVSPSTAVCHSTIRHRSGSRAKARAAERRSSSRTAGSGTPVTTS